MNQDRLYRSVEDRVLAGVCGGLADRLGVDPSLVRIVWVLLTIASGGLFLLIYVVMAIVVPEEDELPSYPAAMGVPPPPSAGAPGTGPTGASGDAGAAGIGATPAAAAGSGTAPGTSSTPAGGVAPAPPPSGWVTPATQAQWRAERRAARAARRAERGPGQGSLVLGIILILLGGWFLLEQYVPAFDPDRFWPFVLLFLGVVLLAFAFGGWPGGRREDKS